jgi:hypothetical protein
MKKTFGVNEYLRVFSRTMAPVVHGMTKVLGLNEYLRGQEPGEKASRPRSSTLSPSHRSGYRNSNRPGRQWAWENSWGYDSEVEHFERELWTEQSFFNDADQGVTYAEAPWDAHWRGDEWWR